MKHLLIRNAGKIIPQDIILMGSSSKRGDDSKIGQFGSGSKYALSWLLRNDCVPRIFSGTDEIIVETKMTEHRGNPRDVIYVAGENTNITTDLGLKWTGWMALRELISNAIDEGGEEVVVINGFSMSYLTKESTCIFVPINEELDEVMNSYDKYFAFDRIPDWIGTGGALYLRPESGEFTIYRKGIRCYNNYNEGLLDFNFNDIPITEDRLIEGGIGIFDQYAKDLLKTVDDTRIIKAAIMSEYGDILPEFSSKWNIDVWIDAYRELLSEGKRFTTKSLKTTLGIITDGHIIPPTHFRELVAKNMVSNPLEAIFSHLDFQFKRTDGPSEEVEKLLKRFGNFKVYFGKMDTYQEVKVKEDEFFIKDVVKGNSPAVLAAKCLMVHARKDELIASLLS